MLGTVQKLQRNTTMEKKLYSWQEDCLKRWFANNSHGMVQAVTGSGKTFLALNAADRLAKTLNLDLRTKIVVPTRTLMYQWYHAIKAYYGDPPKNFIGLRGGGHKPLVDCQYTIYIINSARYELARQILSELRGGKAVLLIADECHHYISEQNQLIFEFIPHMQSYRDHFFSLGLSATLPSGHAGRQLAAALGRKIYTYGITAATARHTICPYDIFHIGLSFQPEESAAYEELTERMLILNAQLLSHCPSLRSLDQKECFEFLRILSSGKDKQLANIARQYMSLTFIRKGLVCMASQRLDCAQDLIRLLGIQQKILIFSERILQAETLYKLLENQYPGKIGRYHSKMGPQANKNALERFCLGDIRILIACKAIDEGVDIPDAAVGIILSGTSVQRQRIQRLGRIIRKKEGKEQALLYYLHVTDSSEDFCFLPDSGPARIFELSYQPENNAFLNVLYDKKAAALIKQMYDAGLSTEKIQEAKQCLMLGSVKTDWMAEKIIIEQHIQNTASKRQKNYWICMKKLAELS